MYGAVKSMSVGSTVQRNEKPQGRLVIEAAYNQFSQSDDISEPGQDSCPFHSTQSQHQDQWHLVSGKDNSSISSSVAAAGHPSYTLVALYIIDCDWLSMV